MTPRQERAERAAALIQSGYAANPETPRKPVDQGANMLRLRREHPERFDRLGPVARMTVGFYDLAQEQEDDDDNDAA